MHRRPPLDQCVDNSQPDRAAEIAHQVEQPAGIRHLAQREIIQRQRSRRQQAQHEGDAARALLPEQAPEIIVRRHEAVADQAGGEQRIARRGQPAQVALALQDGGDRRGDQLRDAGHQHDQADLERIVMAHDAEKQRQQKGRTVEPGAEREAEPAAEHEIAPAKRCEIDQRHGARPAAPDRADPAGQAQHGQPQHQRVGPAPRRRLAQHHLQPGEEQREQRRSGEVARNDDALTTRLGRTGLHHPLLEGDHVFHIQLEQPNAGWPVQAERARIQPCTQDHELP